MSSRFVTLPGSPGSLTLKFVPADRRGVLDHKALGDLAHALADVDQKTLRVAVLEGARPGLFAAGASLEEVSRLDPETAGAFAERARRAFSLWESLPLTTVAFVDGACFGGALDLVLCADIIAATPRARFGHPGVVRGIVTGWGGTYRVRRRLGEAGLRRLFALAEELDADRAAANGLADILVSERSELEPFVAKWCGEEGDILREIKALSRACEGLSREQALALEEYERLFLESSR
ncbi:MAG: enoyl-CoA hydratase/isomerase family protein [Acidobacteria bacterium]|nr:enoyl-CoA hydratase/isomerase family protein [Acidobacteriota bacterium]